MTRVVVPISLPSRLDRRIEKEVKQGRFASKSEYIRDAVRESLDRAEIAAERKKNPKFYAKLDRELQKSLEAVEKGEYYGPFDTVEEGFKFLNSYRKKSRK